MTADRRVDHHPVRRQWKRLERRVDRWLEGGDGRAILLLAAMALAVAVFSAIIFLFLHARLGKATEPLSEVDEGFWEALVRTIDPGQITDDQGSGRIVGLFTTIAGLLLLSTLISLVGNLIERRVERSRRGRDPMEFRRGRDVHDSYHVVLGWSDLTLPLLSQLAHSHKGNQKPDVLVLANRPTAEMREEITEYFARSDSRDPNHKQRPPKKPKHWPELRTGDPTDGSDLAEIARLGRADSAIVLAPEPDGGPLRSPDGVDDLCPASAEVIKTVIAVSAAAGDVGKGEAHAVLPGALRLVVEVPENARGRAQLADLLARRLQVEARDLDGDPAGAGHHRRRIELLPVDVGSLQTYLAARISRRRGLAAVYRELLDFQGCEFHTCKPPAVAPATPDPSFGDLATRLQCGIIVGVLADGTFTVPNWNDPVAAPSKLVVLSEEEFDPS
ncbi:MAG: hypothetical protein ACOYOQ_16700, partial [Microthrixaceae bacterium]